MTDETAGNYAVIYVPTLRERLWRRVGFRFHLGDEPEGTETFPGWMRTNIRLDFGWLDRLRLLLTGRLRVTLSSHFDALSPAVVKSRLDWTIAAPGDGSGCP